MAELHSASVPLLASWASSRQATSQAADQAPAARPGPGLGSCKTLPSGSVWGPEPVNLRPESESRLHKLTHHQAPQVQPTPLHLFGVEISSHSAVSKQLSSAECWCWLAWCCALQLQPTWAALLSRRAYCASHANFKNESESTPHSRSYVIIDID